jgi:hypothetical protein
LANIVGDMDSLHVEIDNLNNPLVGFCFIRSIDSSLCGPVWMRWGAHMYGIYMLKGNMCRSGIATEEMISSERLLSRFFDASVIIKRVYIYSFWRVLLLHLLNPYHFIIIAWTCLSFSCPSQYGLSCVTPIGTEM